KFPGADAAPLFQAFRPQGSAGRIENGVLLERLREAPVGERKEQLSAQVADILADILRLPSAAQVSADQGFFDSGMDSLMSLEFRQRLEREYTITLPPTVAFNYPTVGELIEYLSGGVLDLEFDETGPVSDAFDDEPADEDLSEDDLAALLERQLAE
ncbi:MAG: acyl carrier protein, partial [Gammaproteobacteria bacterium]